LGGAITIRKFRRPRDKTSRDQELIKTNKGIQMGASGWVYFVPYQPDINKALQELREAVFKSGAYYTQAAFVASIDEDEIAKHIPSEYAELFKATLQKLRSEPQPPKPNSIAELLEMNGESGTHSIIDINGISSTPDFGMAAPLSQQQLRKFFGTEKPTRSIVEQHADEIQSLRRRWEATYIIIYRDGSPGEIFFTGFSGD
jgi:hypothetical protein